jgi:hypothetical protein
MMQRWKYVDHVAEGEPLTLGGENVWNHRWKLTGDAATVIDPQDGATRELEVWKIVRPRLSDIVFAAGEFSNGIWGFYVPVER